MANLATVPKPSFDVAAYADVRTIASTARCTARQLERLAETSEKNRQRQDLDVRRYRVGTLIGTTRNRSDEVARQLLERMPIMASRRGETDGHAVFESRLLAQRRAKRYLVKPMTGKTSRRTRR